MAEPTSALSLYDLVLEVARSAEIPYYGVSGAEAAMIPATDADDLDRCLTVVNKAVRSFIDKAPPGGWQWRKRPMEVDLVRGYTGTATAGAADSLTDGGIAGEYDDDYFNNYVLRITAGTGLDEYATVTNYTGSTGKFEFTALSGESTPDATSEYRICRSTEVIDSDPARYLLDEAFQGEVTGDITFKADSNACGLEWTSEGAIRHSREIAVRSGDAPFRAAIYPNSTNRRWELIVDPEPSAEHTVVFPYLANFSKLNLVAGTASGGTIDSLTDASLIGLYPDDYFKGDTIRIISGTGKTSYAVCTGYAGATGILSVADWLFQNGADGGTDPDATSVYYVEPSEGLPCGMQFDNAILSACRAETEREFADVDRGFMQQFLSVDLPAAHAIDGRGGPKKLGVMKSGTGPRVTVVNRGIVYYNTDS